MLRLVPPLDALVGILPFLASPSKASVSERSCRVDGRRLAYAEVLPPGGEETGTVVLLHGWGLTHGSYRRAAQELAGYGFRVLVPDLPGFGRSADLPVRKVGLDGFAGVLRGFLRRVDGEEVPCAHLVGHSFGGAVAIRLAYHSPELVTSLVLVDAATGATWHRSGDTERLLSERPLWDWALHLVQELPLSDFPLAATSVLRDVGHNLVWHLPSVGIVAHLTRSFDIRHELAGVAGLGVPVSVVWADGDRVVTRACYEDQCEAVGREGTVVAGNHGWPMADPVLFGQVVARQLGASAV